jgi:hypothetical protein
MPKEDEMSEAESAAFLRDLESRSKNKPAVAVEDDGEDVEDFLKRLEADEAKSSKPKTKVKDPLEDEFAGLKEAPAANIVKAEEPEKKETKEKPKKGKDVRAVERGSSDGLKRAGQITKWIAVLLPTFVAIWLVGAFVAQWISAGWLVALVALVGVLGIPAALRVATAKGGFLWWLAAFSTLACVGLTAPMTKTAAGVVVSYGHWPASVFCSAVGWDVDHFTVRGSQWVSEKLAGLVDPEVAGAGLRLGTEVPLVATEPVVPDPNLPNSDTPNVDPTAPVAVPVAPVATPVAPVTAPVAPVAAPVAPIAAPVAAPIAAPVVAPVAAPVVTAPTVTPEPAPVAVPQ